MNAAVLRRVGAPLRLEDRPPPQPRGEEVLVRVRGAGVCHSDLHMIDGLIPGLPLPRVLGHEIAGEADRLGPVLVYASWGDGTCRWCQRGEEQLCARVAEPGWARDGGYAEAVLVPSRRYLLPLGDLDPVRAAPLADAGVTAYRAVRRAQPWLAGGGTVVVLGAGGLGQFAIQFLRRAGDQRRVGEARVVAVDPDPAKQDQARRLGADDTASAGGDLEPGAAAAVLDLVGSDVTLAEAARLVRPTGVVMVVGEVGGRLPFGFGAVPHEAHLTTSVWGSRRDLAAVVELARAGNLRWEVEALPLDRVNEALERLRHGRVQGRLVLTP
jgi:propanol-preferring alcohol dehydrogenase